jgi:hypothetical protein
MAKYLLLFLGGGMPATEAEQKAVIQEWTDWYTRLGAAVVDPGNPFTPHSHSIGPDGKVSEGAGGVNGSGYTILQAASLDAATTLARSCPVLKSGAKISVFETFEVGGGM